MNPCASRSLVCRVSHLWWEVINGPLRSGPPAPLSRVFDQPVMGGPRRGV